MVVHEWSRGTKGRRQVVVVTGDARASWWCLRVQHALLALPYCTSTVFVQVRGMYSMYILVRAGTAPHRASRPPAACRLTRPCKTVHVRYSYDKKMIGGTRTRTRIPS